MIQQFLLAYRFDSSQYVWLHRGIPQAVDGPESAQPLGHGKASSLAPWQPLQANVDVTLRSFYSVVAI